MPSKHKVGKPIVRKTDNTTLSWQVDMPCTWYRTRHYRIPCQTWTEAMELANRIAVEDRRKSVSHVS